MPSGDDLWLPQLLADTGLVSSTSDGRRMIQQKAVTVNGDKVQEVNCKVAATGELLIKVGKRRFAKVKFV